MFQTSLLILFLDETLPAYVYICNVMKLCMLPDILNSLCFSSAALLQPICCRWQALILHHTNNAYCQHAWHQWVGNLNPQQPSFESGF